MIRAVLIALVVSGCALSAEEAVVEPIEKLEGNHTCYSVHSGLHGHFPPEICLGQLGYGT